MMNKRGALTANRSLHLYYVDDRGMHSDRIADVRTYRVLIIEAEQKRFLRFFFFSIIGFYN